MSDVERLIDQPIQMFLPHYMNAELPILGQMQMTIFCAPEDAHFITSDDPVARWDTEAHKRPLMYQAHVLGSATIQFTLPISPSMMMKGGIKPVIYRDVTPRLVRDLNQRTWAYANEFIVSPSSQFDANWVSKETHPPHDP
jgi:hypothetical protein